MFVLLSRESSEIDLRILIESTNLGDLWGRRFADWGDAGCRKLDEETGCKTKEKENDDGNKSLETVVMKVAYGT
jgi:hypothetical protein